MSSGARVMAVSGSGPVVLLAPHGGRRDPVRRPWTSGRLRVNDLHTASLTTELARLLDAPALINESCDRNDVDLNRVSEAHDGAPEFLAQLASILERTVARHGRATVLVVHGWNVIEPVVDLGLGCAPGADPFVVDGRAAVSASFAATGVRALVEACAARGIAATVGARYPARHRENLLQLFTPRYGGDPRPLVRAVAALAPRVDAVQLELGIPLRWPGPWRTRLLDACAAAHPALAGAPALPRPSPALAHAGAIDPPHPVRLEFTSPALCGLIAADRGGARLLLFPPDGGLVLLTSERIAAGAGHAPGLRITSTGDGRLAIRFRGPLLHFPDTLPFLDLEPGLAGARLIEADLALDFSADDAAHAGGTFGGVDGGATIDGVAHAIAGVAFSDPAHPSPIWPRFRTALRVRDDVRLVLTLGLDGCHTEGFLDRRGHREAVTSARLTLATGEAPLARIALVVELAGGEQLPIEASALHRLPVIRARSTTPVRLEFAACRVHGGPPGAAGWCELGGT